MKTQRQAGKETKEGFNEASWSQRIQNSKSRQQNWRKQEGENLQKPLEKYKNWMKKLREHNLIEFENTTHNT